MKGLKVFISGKITGDDDYKPRFVEVEAMLKARGYTVINPAFLPFGMSARDYMRICFAMIDTADIVYFMRGSEKSKGSLLEWQYCQYTGKHTIRDRG